MRMTIAKVIMGVLLGSTASTLLVLNAQQSPAAGKSQMKQGKGMMSGQAMGQSIMSQHQAMSKLIDQVTADLAALQNEKDLGTIQKKLAADHALLEQVRSHMQEQGGMMGPMMDRMKMMDKMGSQATSK